MRLGISGLPQSGKTTIFNALTVQDLPTGFGSTGQLEVHTAVVSVPDARIDFLSDLYHPKKTTYATVTFKDIGGLDSGVGEGQHPVMRQALPGHEHHLLQRLRRQALHRVAIDVLDAHGWTFPDP